RGRRRERHRARSRRGHGPAAVPARRGCRERALDRRRHRLPIAGVRLERLVGDLRAYASLAPGTSTAAIRSTAANAEEPQDGTGTEPTGEAWRDCARGRDPQELGPQEWVRRKGRAGERPRGWRDGGTPEVHGGD